jgi:nucleotide-binding universal stress UspA family protein
MRHVVHLASGPGDLAPGLRRATVRPSSNDETELNADLPMTYEFWEGEEEEGRVLAEALAGIIERYPDLRVRRQVRRGFARRLLTGWSRTAQLVVVGRRGHGGLLLGSVGQHLLHHAGCPTAVVRPGARGAPGRRFGVGHEGARRGAAAWAPSS